jgi:cytochrome c553
MIKHVIAGISVILALWAFVYMFNLDKEVNKLANIQSIINKSEIKVHLVKEKTIKKEVQQSEQANSTAKRDRQVEDKLQALKDKAGNMSAFKVSPLYKKNCSSCHGGIGKGIIGPKLMGRSKDYILKNLKEFKSGKRKNYVMYGLLGNLSDQQLVDLATEIGTFQEKLDKANN